MILRFLVDTFFFKLRLLTLQFMLIHNIVKVKIRSTKGISKWLYMDCHPLETTQVQSFNILCAQKLIRQIKGWYTCADFVLISNERQTSVQKYCPLLRYGNQSQYKHTKNIMRDKGKSVQVN